MSRLRWMGKLDMYRKVPMDLMEGTKRGSFLSLFAVFVMLMLFLLETGAFFKKRMITDLALDTSDEKRVRINFNITMMDLKCEYTVVDVVSILGTEQNVTSNIIKWHVDGAGVRQMYQGRNKEQHDIALHDERVKETLEELLEEGEEAISVDEQTFDFALKEMQFLFVDFYASWCSHCRQLAPTWEVLAKAMIDVAEDKVEEHNPDISDEEYEAAVKVHLPVMVAKVDCVIHKELCHKQMIQAYPTLRLFVDGERWKAGDYKGHRTVTEMVHWLTSVEDAYKEEVGKNETRLHAVHQAVLERLGKGEESAEEHEWAEKIKNRKAAQAHQVRWVDEDHPGCQISGHLLVDRVPGNFHIQARSPHHDMNPHMANMSHEIHSLSVGEPLAITWVNKGTFVAPDEVKRKISPMDGNVYVTSELHEAFHHYLKVVTTHLEGLNEGKKTIKNYQIIQSSQLAMYRNDLVPEAKFVMDLSPISVSYRTTSRHWYDYVTSLMAIVGGTFTVVGMMESSIQSVVHRKKKMRY
mmetsp:Transcript_6781/g.8787  ORF Transcript_6781/g.8787 Transcript_6781/m.8787 type:complete len:523 (+) Transcript_6781:194-1762(+)|eukprot:CAMPEP_0198147630 /NCGR_PEP_ID=MMETSP1443-20131203/36906_1 /TAXON_ID=186043 /ORGANISM="Entomoneis sp., Strain CCMP2396" /LENGTH=522 /DNA_ID=CAMNT_0043812041 /DNA_START=176 /DNA_END=1744 /DNA_ORIENTATION=+